MVEQAVVHTLGEVEPAHGGGGGDSDRGGVCVMAVAALDRFVSTGLFVVMVAMAPVVCLALVVCCGLLQARRRCRRKVKTQVKSNFTY